MNEEYWIYEDSFLFKPDFDDQINNSNIINTGYVRLLYLKKEFLNYWIYILKIDISVLLFIQTQIFTSNPSFKSSISICLIFSSEHPKLTCIINHFFSGLFNIIGFKVSKLV